MIELPTIKRVFAASRGLPAVEIVDAMHSMGLEAAVAATPSEKRSAAYERADIRTGLPVAESHIERESYVNMDWMIEAAMRVDADAIHPGYGFLSEDPDFARRVELSGLHFVGPTEHALRVFGSKTQFRQHARLSGVPVIPASRQFIFSDTKGQTGRWRGRLTKGFGTAGSIVGKGLSPGRRLPGADRLDGYSTQMVKALAGTIAERVWPMTMEGILNEAVEFIRRYGDIVVKSPYGGGGMGTVLLSDISKQIISNPEAALSTIGLAIKSANRTSERAKRRGIYFEKLIENAGHIEMQAIADKHHNVHIMGFERDCSWQFSERKMVEQSPSAKINEDERRQLQTYAKSIIREIGSHGIFTVEFLKDMKDGEIYALEVNPRLQVEHKVTEGVTWVEPGVNLRLIPVQIEIARGQRYEVFPHETQGHSVEIRVLVNVDEAAGAYLKDVVMPSGEGIHVITEFGQDLYVPGGYDGNCAKIVAYGEDADQANDRLVNALKSTRIMGAENNIDFVIANMERGEFRDGSYTTSFMKGLTPLDVFQRQ